MNAIMTRRSTRKFTEQSVEPEKLERILRAAMQSPTGHDAQDWEFLIVTDPAVRERVSQTSPFTVSGSGFVATFHAVSLDFSDFVPTTESTPPSRFIASNLQ